MTNEQRQRIVDEARRLVGVPFQHAGRNENGVDCVGLLVLAARNAGIEVYDNSSYSPVVDGEYMQAEVKQACVQVDWNEDVLIADVLLFSVGRHPQHLALVSEVDMGLQLMMIHSYQTVGRVVEHMYDHTWERRLMGVYRLKD